MNTADYIDFAVQWGVTLPLVAAWTDLLPLIERVREAKRGYFIFKLDGERPALKYTFTVNLPYPSDVVLRKDTDCIDEGLAAVMQDLRAAGVRPGEIRNTPNGVVETDNRTKLVNTGCLPRSV